MGRLYPQEQAAGGGCRNDTGGSRLWPSRRQRFTEHSPLLPRSTAQEEKKTMGRTAATVLYVLALVAVVVGADVLFFRHQFWERLIANIGIVLVFAAFYFRFLKRP